MCSTRYFMGDMEAVNTVSDAFFGLLQLDNKIIAVINPVIDMCFSSVTFISRYNSNEENFIRQRPNACPGQRNLQSHHDSADSNIHNIIR